MPVFVLQSQLRVIHEFTRAATSNDFMMLYARVNGFFVDIRICDDDTRH